MKRLCLVVAGTAALMSSAFVHAEGCAYGKHAAADAASSPVISAVDEIDASLSDELKLIEEQAAADALIQAPVIHN